MRWRGQRQSSNVSVAKGGAAVSLGGIVIAVIYALLGGDPTTVLNNGGGGGSKREPLDQANRSEEQQFAAVVLADTEDVWNEVFNKAGHRYEEPQLVLFSGAVQSACGRASSAVGPFYCPRDKQVYLDLSFFKELENRLGAEGDFARAYVIAHEVGHHVQNLLGVLNNEEGKSVQTELQADCLAGMWAKEAQRMRQILEQGDFEEALGAASAVGDDRLQKKSQGYVVPDSFTHGTSAQRAHWFQAGFEATSIEGCDTSQVGTAH
jgi:uncharacterized protein